MNIFTANSLRALLLGSAALTLNTSFLTAQTAQETEIAKEDIPEGQSSEPTEKTTTSEAPAQSAEVPGQEPSTVKDDDIVQDSVSKQNDETPTIVVKNTNVDDAAVAKLHIADNHRNYRTNFGYKDSQKEALKLYNEIMDDKAISPDVRARAKINYADVYMGAYWMEDTKSEDRNNEALRLYNEVAHEADISADLKGWAKRRLSSLYAHNSFDMEAADARKKAVSLLEEVSNDKDVSSETKARAKISLASHYTNKDNQKDLDITEEQGKEKAITILNEVIADTKARPDLRAEAKLSLAEHTSEEDDFYNEKMLKLYKEVIADKDITPELRASTKKRLAYKYIWGDSFNVKKSEGHKIALKLMEEAAAEPTLPIKERLEYKRQLKYWYSAYSDMLPSEANAKALEITKEIMEESRVDAKEYFKARINLANELCYNRYKQKPAAAAEASKKIFKELLEDKTLPIEDRIEVRKDLASTYLWDWRGHFKPDDGKDVKTAILDLYNEILNDPELKQEEWYETKRSIADMYNTYNAEKLGMKKKEAKEEKLRLYNELVEDKKLTLSQKKKVKEQIEKLEKEGK